MTISPTKRAPPVLARVMMNRRSLLTGLLCAIASPAIVRASSLMPVRAYLGIDLAGPDPDVTVMLRLQPLSPGFKVGDIISAERMTDAELQAVFGIPRLLLVPALPNEAIRQRFVVTAMEVDPYNHQTYLTGKAR